MPLLRKKPVLSSWSSFALEQMRVRVMLSIDFPRLERVNCAVLRQGTGSLGLGHPEDCPPLPPHEALPLAGCRAVPLPTSLKSGLRSVGVEQHCLGLRGLLKVQRSPESASRRAHQVPGLGGRQRAARHLAEAAPRFTKRAETTLGVIWLQPASAQAKGVDRCAGNQAGADWGVGRSCYKRSGRGHPACEGRVASKVWIPAGPTCQGTWQWRDNS